MKKKKTKNAGVLNSMRRARAAEILVARNSILSGSGRVAKVTVLVQPQDFFPRRHPDGHILPDCRIPWHSADFRRMLLPREQPSVPFARYERVPFGANTGKLERGRNKNRFGDYLLRYLTILPRYVKMDLIAACVAVTSLFVAQTSPLKDDTVALAPPAVASPARSVMLTEQKLIRHPLAAMANLGLASWYGDVLDGHTTASGEIFHKEAMTACHRTLPFGTMVRVVDVHSGKSVVVKINDRGKLNSDRIIDLSSGAAYELGILQAGVARVRLEILAKVEGVGHQSKTAKHDESARSPEIPPASPTGQNGPSEAGQTEADSTQPSAF